MSRIRFALYSDGTAAQKALKVGFFAVQQIDLTAFHSLTSELHILFADCTKLGRCRLAFNAVRHGLGVFLRCLAVGLRDSLLRVGSLPGVCDGGRVIQFLAPLVGQTSVPRPDLGAVHDFEQIGTNSLVDVG
jgi:hypothetical protein